MSGNLNSLTDVLKKTLYFFESLSVAELTSYVHKQMLKDYSAEQVEEKVRLCLEQHSCFKQEKGHNWTLQLEGQKENDPYYTLLLKKQKPFSFAEMTKNNKKKKGKSVSEQAVLINDGRFIQLANGYWGLTEWEVEVSHYSLKHLVTKALKMNPTGLSLTQLREAVGAWRAAEASEIAGVLIKFPYFEEIGNGVWCYNSEAKVIYDSILKRYLLALRRQRDRWIRDRERWAGRVKSVQKQLTEVESAHREVAAALALRQNEVNRFEQLNTQMAEKDLLLALRKKEIYRYKEHLQKLESKANSILYQCRLWVKRARDNEMENRQFREALNKNQSGLETMFNKLQQYKERDRENKTKILEIKELHAERVAELQTEIVNLKQKIERLSETRDHEEKIWREEINTLSTDLKHAMSEGERLNRSLRLSQQEINKIKNEFKALEKTMEHPLVKLVAKLFCKFKKSPQQIT